MHEPPHIFAFHLDRPSNLLPLMEVVRALEEVWTAVVSRLSSLDASQWSLPTPNLEWDVKDLAAHLGGLEALFQGFPQPDPPPGWTTEHTGLHQMTALGVAARRSWTTGEVLDELQRASQAQVDKLRGLDEEGWQTHTLGPVGMTTQVDFADIRLGDIYVHLLDLRYTLGEPLSAGFEPTAERLVVERAVALTGWGAVKGAGLPDGTRIRLELSGPGGATVDVAVENRRGNLLEPDPATPQRIAGRGIAYLLAVAGRPQVAAAAGGVVTEGADAQALVAGYRLFG